ncbi:MAG: hypothetical protein WBV22_04320 [Anaerolineaceae bacterium]
MRYIDFKTRFSFHKFHLEIGQIDKKRQGKGIAHPVRNSLDGSFADALGHPGKMPDGAEDQGGDGIKLSV